MPPKLMKTPRTIVLVGLMGAGKSCIGRRLASQLALDFVDADAEIERAAGCSTRMSPPGPGLKNVSTTRSGRLS